MGKGDGWGSRGRERTGGEPAARGREAHVVVDGPGADDEVDHLGGLVALLDGGGPGEGGEEGGEGEEELHFQQEGKSRLL